MQSFENHRPSCAGVFREREMVLRGIDWDLGGLELGSGGSKQ